MPDLHTESQRQAQVLYGDFTFLIENEIENFSAAQHGMSFKKGK